MIRVITSVMTFNVLLINHSLLRLVFCDQCILWDRNHKLSSVTILSCICDSTPPFIMLKKMSYVGYLAVISIKRKVEDD